MFSLIYQILNDVSNNNDISNNFSFYNNLSYVDLSYNDTCNNNVIIERIDILNYTDNSYHLIPDISNNNSTLISRLIRSLYQNNRLYNTLLNNDNENENENNDIINNFIDSTMFFNKKYIKVTSDEEINNLKIIKYNNNSNYKNNKCPIFFNEFNEDDEIICLPCNHIFTPDAIIKWLTNESNTCPVCRYEFNFKEIINKSYSNTDLSLQIVPSSLLLLPSPIPSPLIPLPLNRNLTSSRITNIDIDIDENINENIEQGNLSQEYILMQQLLYESISNNNHNNNNNNNSLFE